MNNEIIRIIVKYYCSDWHEIQRFINNKPELINVDVPEDICGIIFKDNYGVDRFISSNILMMVNNKPLKTYSWLYYVLKGDVNDANLKLQHKEDSFLNLELFSYMNSTNNDYIVAKPDYQLELIYDIWHTFFKKHVPFFDFEEYIHNDRFDYIKDFFSTDTIYDFVLNSNCEKICDLFYAENLSDFLNDSYYKRIIRQDNWIEKHILSLLLHIRYEMEQTNPNPLVNINYLDKTNLKVSFLYEVTNVFYDFFNNIILNSGIKEETRNVSFEKYYRLMKLLFVPDTFFKMFTNDKVKKIIDTFNNAYKLL